MLDVYTYSVNIKTIHLVIHFTHFIGAVTALIVLKKFFFFFFLK